MDRQYYDQLPIERILRSPDRRFYSIEHQGLWEGKIVDGFFIATTRNFVQPTDSILQDLEVFFPGVDKD